MIANGFRWFAVIGLAGLSLASPAMTHDRGGNLAVEQPWARSTAGQARVGAAYMTFFVRDERDRLVAVSSPIAERAEIHTHVMEGDVVKMRRVEALEVSPGEPTVLRPGGHHIMLMGLTQPLIEGETFPLTLTFERFGPITVDVVVQAPGAMEPHQKTERGHQS